MIFLICISCDACNLAFCLPPLQPERFVNLGIEPPKGVLLFGPPGTGKTLCARAVANRTDACFIRVIGSELVQKYVGEVRANTGWSVERFAAFQSRGLDALVGMMGDCTCTLEILGAGRNGQTNHCQSGSRLSELKYAVINERDCAVPFNLQFRRTLGLGFCSQLCHSFFTWL